jgi:hypothetical protein
MKFFPQDVISQKMKEYKDNKENKENKETKDNNEKKPLFGYMLFAKEKRPQS